MAYAGKHQIQKTKQAKTRSLSRASSATRASSLPASRSVSRPSSPPARRSVSLRLFHPLFCLLVTLLYLELLLRVTCSLPRRHAGLPGALCGASAHAAAAALICFLPRSERASRILCLVWMELFTVWYVIAFFMDNSYGFFICLTIIARES